MTRRATCPICRRPVALRTGGELRRHGVGTRAGLCPGSGFPPEVLAASAYPTGIGGHR